MKLLLQGGYALSDIIRMLDDVQSTRDEMLGPRSERTSQKVFFENHRRAEPVRNGPRCYGHNSMFQQTRVLASPPAALKTYEDGPDDYQKMVRDYIRVSCFVCEYD